MRAFLKGHRREQLSLRNESSSRCSGPPNHDSNPAMDLLQTPGTRWAPSPAQIEATQQPTRSNHLHRSWESDARRQMSSSRHNSASRPKGTYETGSYTLLGNFSSLAAEPS